MRRQYPEAVRVRDQTGVADMHTFHGMIEQKATWMRDGAASRLPRREVKIRTLASIYPLRVDSRDFFAALCVACDDFGAGVVGGASLMSAGSSI